MSTEREKQIAEAEELLSDRKPEIGFAKGLFFGRFQKNDLLPYPDISASLAVERLVGDLREFCRQYVDASAIDKAAEIPQSVIDGLGQLGILGACVPIDCDGKGLSQTEYCRLIEVLGGHCGSTALFVNAHHSIGPRALVLFGNRSQQEKWLPKLASGESISAFALTEPEAGSDASNVQTTAVPTPDGKGFLLNGQKRWITNGGVAQVLTVMARTPLEHETINNVADSDAAKTASRRPGSGKPSASKITAFIVTPDMPGFEIVEKRMEKCGVRGTATARLAFHDMFVPKENVLGQLGKGLKVALTVLDFGRTTFGASCTGAAKYCVARAKAHAETRVQFGQPIGTFELVQEKLAYMTAGTFAMEAATYQTASLIDSGAGDYMLETAMLKVFSTEVLWKIVNDTFQIFGGKAYFTDEPFERMMRDARINMIGEGANDVLRAFTALVGMRDVGLELKGVFDAVFSPFGIQNLRKLGGFAGRQLESVFTSPEVRVTHPELEPDAKALGKLIGQFGGHVQKLLRTYREQIMDRQYQLGRVADIATELFVSSCVLNRLDFLLGQRNRSDSEPRRDLEPNRIIPPLPLGEGRGEGSSERHLTVGRYFLATAARRIRRTFLDLWDNDDTATTATAKV